MGMNSKLWWFLATEWPGLVLAGVIAACLLLRIFW